MPSNFTLLPGYKPTASVNSAQSVRSSVTYGTAARAATTAAPTRETTMSSTAAAVPRDRRRRRIPVSIRDSRFISTLLHDVGQAQVLSGHQEVALVDRDTVAAEHRPDDLQDLP